MSLKSAIPVELVESDLKLELSTKFHKDKIMESDNRVELEKMVHECENHVAVLEGKVKQERDNMVNKMQMQMKNPLIRDRKEHFTNIILNPEHRLDTKAVLNSMTESVPDTYDSKLKENFFQENDIGCMMPSGKCGALCSGSGQNPCNLVAPIPGPQWQPQSASTVQNRLNAGKYVKSNCF